MRNGRPQRRSMPAWISSVLGGTGAEWQPVDSAGLELWNVSVRLAPPAQAATSRSRIEPAVVHRIRDSGWLAFWIPGFRVAGYRRISEEFPGDVATVRRLIKEAPPSLRARLQRMRTELGKTGWPDVVAWDPTGGSVIFVECKRPREPLTPSQTRWWGAALELGLVSPDESAVCRCQVG